HLWKVVLDLWVIGHRARESERRALLRGRDCQIASPECDTVVDAAEHQEGVGENAQNERVDASGGNEAPDIAVGHEHALQDSVVASRGPHSERVPGLLDRVTLAVAGNEGMNYPGAGRVAGIHRMDTEPRPHG